MMTNTKKNILEQLFSLQRNGIKPGLKRTRNLLKSIGNPHKKFPTIHIAGTNGKGSVASIIASVLQESGYKVGLYTSPHIIDFNERIRVNGVKIKDKHLVALSSELLHVAQNTKATFFEITTAIAFTYFNLMNVDIAIIETGLGGRFDSTNVIKPNLSIITSIAIEHVEYLGDTIEKIAFEKAGILKRNVPCVVGKCDNEALEVIKSVSETTRSSIITSESGSAEIIGFNKNLTMTIDVNSFKKSYGYIITPLVGLHQKENHLTAINSLEIIREEFPFPDINIYNGIENVKKNTGLRYRFEAIEDHNNFIIDVAHNPAAFLQVAETLGLTLPNESFNFLFGAMADKDIYEMLKAIKPLCNELIITQPSINRAADIQTVADIAQSLEFQKTIVFQTPNKAFLYAKKTKYKTVIAGSFYLIGDLHKYLHIKT